MDVSLSLFLNIDVSQSTHNEKAYDAQYQRADRHAEHPAGLEKLAHIGRTYEEEDSPQSER